MAAVDKPVVSAEVRLAKLTQGIGKAAWKNSVLKTIGKTVWQRHDELEELTTHVLSRPDVIAHAAWPDFVRALTTLTASFTQMIKDGYGETVSIDDEAEDESGTMDRIADEKGSTVELVLGLLARPEAIARSDWPVLLTFVCREKRERLGDQSFGDDEIKKIFAIAAVKKHPQVTTLRAVAKKSFPYAGLK